MAKMLTLEEWRVQKAPMAFTRIKFESWTDLHYELCEKWIAEHCEGWACYHRSASAFVFGLQSDAALFDIWLEEGVVERERGNIEGRE